MPKPSTVARHIGQQAKRMLAGEIDKKAFAEFAQSRISSVSSKLKDLKQVSEFFDDINHNIKGSKSNQMQYDVKEILLQNKLASLTGLVLTESNKDGIESVIKTTQSAIKTAKIARSTIGEKMISKFNKLKHTEDSTKATKFLLDGLTAVKGAATALFPKERDLMEKIIQEIKDLSSQEGISAREVFYQSAGLLQETSKAISQSSEAQQTDAPSSFNALPAEDYAKLESARESLYASAKNYFNKICEAVIGAFKSAAQFCSDLAFGKAEIPQSVVDNLHQTVNGLKAKSTYPQSKSQQGQER